MNLFDSIGLKADPFSTSPNVDLFYPAVEHRQCLEGLELAIRMRRGLSVVKGGIGVGKTTISRKLIQNFKDESDDYDFYLILDPKFESEIILLKHIIELFGINESADSVQDCRNIIENFLLKVGVEQGKTLVLIIDEGQNLPGEMLDVFRTLLNFETDDFKLLQLIIFGQPEMGKMIHKYPNFEDRISFDFEIGPINLEDMKGMIDHRIQITGGVAGSWFTEKSILKIHKNTQGYPRKITQLCHQILLAMISEEQNEINEEMVQRVISGKVDTGGLLKQKKKNYNQIAVNKLLDVIRKDDPDKDSVPSSTIQDDDDDDDWIGASPTDKDTVPKEIEPVIIESDTAKKEINLERKEKELLANSKIEEDSNNTFSSLTLDEKISGDFLPNQGKYPRGVTPSILNQLPIDKTFIGLHIDQGRIFATVIQEKNAVKTLLSHNSTSTHGKYIDPQDDPDEFINICSNLIDLCIDDLLDYGDLYKPAIKYLDNKAPIALTINHDQILLLLVKVPKENQKEKDKIIEWTISKDLNFPIEDCIINTKKGRNDNFLVGIGEKSALDNISKPLVQDGWSIRKLLPINQVIYNAFIWNYPEKRKKNIIIIHVGEKTGSILGSDKSGLRVVRPLFIGFESLRDALRDNGFSDEKFKDIPSYQVPASFLKMFGQTVEKGEYDDVFRAVFENWRQEIERTINGIRKDFKIVDGTEILLSGSIGEIRYLDKFIEGITGLNTAYLNPIRNLLMPPEFELSSIESHPSLFAPAIGSALNIQQSVNILPKDLKQEETLRWINRAGVVLSSVALTVFFALSISTKLSIESLQSEIKPLRLENNKFGNVESNHRLLNSNKSNVEEQIEILKYDTDYFNRILAISKFLSYYTPKEVLIEELNFQEGWDVKGYKKVGRDLVKVVKKEDTHLRIVRLAGTVQSNTALLSSHFRNFLSSLEESGLFQNIEIMNESSQEELGKDKIQFELKCVI